MENGNFPCHFERSAVGAESRNPLLWCGKGERILTPAAQAQNDILILHAWHAKTPGAEAPGAGIMLLSSKAYCRRITSGAAASR